MSRTRLKEVCFHNCSGIRHLRKERKSSTECKSKEIQPRMCIGQEAAFLSGFQKADEGGWHMPSSEPHPLSVQWLQDCHAHQRAIIENVSCLAPPDSPGNRLYQVLYMSYVHIQTTNQGGGALLPICLDLEATELTVFFCPPFLPAFSSLSSFFPLFLPSSLSVFFFAILASFLSFSFLLIPSSHSTPFL